MKISKSLFVEYGRSPKAARFYVNDKERYQAIREDRYWSMDGKAIGDSVEDAVKALLQLQGLAISKPAGKRWQSLKPTQDLVNASHIDVIEQWRFQTSQLHCATDLLVRNEFWQFDLWEIKAKNTVRSSSTAQPLKDDLRDDVSFQHYLLKQTLGELFSGKVKLVYLNKDYVRHWDLDLEELLRIEDVTNELLTDEEVATRIHTMQSELGMSEEWFNLQHPYKGWNYVEYFWSPAPNSSIWTYNIHSSKRKKLYDSWYTLLEQLPPEALEILKNKDGSDSKALEFVERWQSAQTVIDSKKLTQELSKLEYPLYFYDYETICVPIPFVQDTSPWQQVVVQYSVHKISEEGTIQHREWIIQDKISNNKDLIDQLVEDLDHWAQWTYIVRYDSFENHRNTESGAMYPEYADIFELINAKTYDLMDIFKHHIYFDRRFEWSCSIKKVLPVLTDISYEGLAVPKWDIASALLEEIARGQLSWENLELTKTNLLEYCKQDTRAMVAIWEKLKDSVKQQ